MTREHNPTLWGGILIALGVLFLLTNWGLLGTISRVLWAVLFFAGGASFLIAYGRDRRQWQALIPGFVLLALGAVVAFGDAMGALGGSLFLGLIGLGFAAVYFADKKRWWAIIPAGVLLTLAVVASLTGAAAGTVFLLGIAATFGFVYFAPTNGVRQTWAVYPAVAALVLAALTVNLFAPLLTIGVPLALILLGLYLLWQQRGSMREH
jgi:hypothetical protein